jgi:chorismate synthase
MPHAAPKGRFAVGRAVPVAEAMLALALADHWLRFKAQCR